MEKVELTLLDRLTIPSLLKKEGTFEEMIIGKDLKNKIMITQKELLDFEIKTIPNGMQWNEKGAEAKFEYELTGLELGVIKEGLKKLQDEKKLTEDHIDLYRKFIK